MFYYRQRILVSLMLAFGGFIKSTHLQKLLFLFTREQQKKSYDFIPYHYGCFSFQANKDLIALHNRGILEKKESDQTNWWKVNDLSDQDIPIISRIDSELLKSTKKKYLQYSQEDIIRYTYINYPYYDPS